MGNILTISGPRGVGKTSIMRDLNDGYGIEPIVPYTTRPMRDGEVDGIDYRFTTPGHFDHLCAERPMFDVLSLGGNQYGTPLADFQDVIDPGSPDTLRSVNLAADTAIQLQSRLGHEAVRTLFILPASWEDIEKQMKDTGLEEEKIRARCDYEPTDLTVLPKFNRLVLNVYRQQADTVEQIAEYAKQAHIL